jgi:hypothetical protein
MHNGQQTYRLVSADELLAMPLPETRTWLTFWVQDDCWRIDLHGCDMIASGRPSELDYQYTEMIHPGMQVLMPSDPAVVPGADPAVRTPEPDPVSMVLIGLVAFMVGRLRK